MTDNSATVCHECPWLIANQGRRTSTGLYSHKALINLWNKLRRGTSLHICPLKTKAEASRQDINPDTQVECPASIALIYRELAKLYHTARPATKVTHTHFQQYAADNPLGLTQAGVTHWTIIRPKLPPQLGGNPIPRIPRSLLHDHTLISRPEN